MISRLGLLGGMFDPVHNGHMQAARFALRELNLDQCRMIPCHNPNHRDPATSDSIHRLNMLKLATAGDANITVDPIEINRSGVSYTIDTLLQLQQAWVDASLVFILGADSFNSLPQWHRWIELFDHCHFLVLARAGSSIVDELDGKIDVVDRLVESEQQLFASPAGKILLARNFENEISSTQVRERLVENEDVSQLLDSAVIDYIQQHNLYSQSIAK